MAANVDPIFPLTSNVKQSQAAPTAVTSFSTNDSVNKTLAWSAGLNGSILQKIVVSVPVTNSVVDQISFWISDGVNFYWWKSVLIPVGGTLSATVQPQRVEVPALNTAEVFPTTWSIFWSSFVGGQLTTVACFGADY